MNPLLALALLLLLLAGPLMAAPLEHNIELFFLMLGLMAAWLGGGLNAHAIGRALREPIPITAALVAAGAAFVYGRVSLQRLVGRAARAIGAPLFAGCGVFVIALASSLITAVVGALVLAELITAMNPAPADRLGFAVSGCLAIGMGAVLTPLGEPLATIAAAELHTGFWGLTTLLGAMVLPGVALGSVLAGYFARRAAGGSVQQRTENIASVLIQGARIYAFVAGLILLGDGFGPLAIKYVTKLSAPTLFWINSVSAVTDNAALVAIELRALNGPQARSAIISLLAAGVMMIPGNIPNIVCAQRLDIGSHQWARVGVPLGLSLMTAYFVALHCLV